MSSEAKKLSRRKYATCLVRSMGGWLHCVQCVARFRESETQSAIVFPHTRRRLTATKHGDSLQYLGGGQLRGGIKVKLRLGHMARFGYTLAGCWTGARIMRRLLRDVV